MNIQGVVDLFRIEMHDTATPPLWADEQLFVYLDDAQKEFARLTGGIPDSTSAITEVTLSVGDTDFELDERILKVRSAYRTSDGQSVAVINYEDMAMFGIRFDGTEGPIAAIIIGMDAKTAYTYPVVSVADTIKMVLDRLPLKDISVDDDSDTELEVSKHHRLHLLEHMKALAYGNQDAEIFNKTKSLEHAAKFEMYCDRVKKEKDRRKHKTRVVQYGGLPMATTSADPYRRR